MGDLVLLGIGSDLSLSLRELLYSFELPSWLKRRFFDFHNTHLVVLLLSRHCWPVLVHLLAVLTAFGFAIKGVESLIAPFIYAIMKK
ncbi:unnamed protein product [Citrullus colocynthis]|uniref:Uncharacterized protein n=1 Tax=Citrullus colocynthis TaxID=252529 RepID=A0ABP0YNT0_9ROSI